MKITKEELIRIIKEEVNKARVKRPVDEQVEPSAKSVTTEWLFYRLQTLHKDIERVNSLVYAITDALPEDIVANIDFLGKPRGGGPSLEEENKE